MMYLNAWTNLKSKGGERKKKSIFFIHGLRCIHLLAIHACGWLDQGLGMSKSYALLDLAYAKSLFLLKEEEAPLFHPLQLLLHHFSSPCTARRSSPSHVSSLCKLPWPNYVFQTSFPCSTYSQSCTSLILSLVRGPRSSIAGPYMDLQVFHSQYLTPLACVSPGEATIAKNMYRQLVQTFQQTTSIVLLCFSIQMVIKEASKLFQIRDLQR